MMIAHAPSNTHYVCVPCRNVHKQTSVCEFCHSSMQDLGPNFKTPRRTDSQQWKKIEVMLSVPYGNISGNLNGLMWSYTYPYSNLGQPKTFAEAKQRRREKRRQRSFPRI